MNERMAVGDDLLRSAARLSRWASRHASFDVPFAQARLLALLDELGPSRVSTLAIADNTSQPTMTVQVQRLHAAGWADRLPDAEDARAALIALTPAGRETLADIRRARSAALRPALDQLSEPAAHRLQTAVEVLDELLRLATTSSRPPSRKDG